MWPFNKRKESQPVVAASSSANDNGQPKTEREKLYAYINQPDVARNLFESAKNLEERFKGNRFTLEQICKKTNVKNPIAAQQLMNLLELKGYAHREVVENGKAIKYKVGITRDARLAVLEHHQRELLAQYDAVTNDIEGLRSDIEEKVA